MLFINHIRDALLVNHVSCGPLRVMHVASLLAVLFFIIVCFDSHIFRIKIDVNSHHNTALSISRTSPWKGGGSIFNACGVFSHPLLFMFSCYVTVNNAYSNIICDYSLICINFDSFMMMYHV